MPSCRPWFRARLRAPGRSHETQALGLCADGGDDVRMLVTQIAAFGQTAHIQVLAPRVVTQACALAADNGWGPPFGLHAPTVQHAVALTRHVIPPPAFVR